MGSQRFQDVRLIVMNLGAFRNGAAACIPGLGIVASQSSLRSHALLRHEYGHMLQYRKWGFFVYWLLIAPASLLSARKARKNKSYNHMHCWTEWTANQLSFQYFSEPADWDLNRYPIVPPSAGFRVPPILRSDFDPDGKIKSVS